MHLKKLSPKDIETLREIGLKSNRYSFNELFNLSGKPFVDILTLSDESRILAYAVIWKFPPEAELHYIEVFSPFRGLGWGEKFLKGIVEKLRREGFKKLLLEVSESNGTALKLYGKFSPKVIGKRKRYYPDGSDALLLEIEI
jgi:ribosomal-protein-alanine N-acetyltransferase